jgi:opacity protein-like surface antigen
MLFVALMTLGFSTAALAQFSIGARVAANLSNVATSSDDEDFDLDTKNHFGLAFGAAVEIGVSEMFAIQPEILFSQHGFRIEESFFGQTIKLTQRHSYLQIPILAKLMFGSEALGINVFVGPHVGFGIGDITLDAEFGGEKDSESASWEDAGFKTFDFGVTGGVGVAFPVGPGKLGLDVRYQLGLANIIDEPEDNDKASNRNIQIGLSYMIPIGR